MNVLSFMDGTGPVSPAVAGRVVSATEETQAVWRVPEEVPLAVLVNGRSFAVMMVTPADLEDFAVGFALTEGLAEEPQQIHGLRIAEAADGFLANLLLDASLVERAEARRRTLAGRSGCGICGAQTIAAALPKLRRVRGLAPSAAALRTAYAMLPGAQAMNAENRSTHAAAYCDPEGRLLLLREDIGRHNALDKLGGALARAHLSAADGFILLSSRISVEMVQKAAVLGCSFLAAVSGPSALALRQAEAAGIGLACRSGEGIMLFDAASLGRSPA